MMLSDLKLACFSIHSRVSGGGNTVGSRVSGSLFLPLLLAVAAFNLGGGPTKGESQGQAAQNLLTSSPVALDLVEFGEVDPREEWSLVDSQEDSPIPSVAQRFAADGQNAANVSGEIPDFQKHISPLLGRLGCNGRACHGSFQGQGGLRLSLFGFDFASDHAALLEDGSGRIDGTTPEDSLILAKPTDPEDHGGGQLMTIESWQYRVLRNWIEGGARPTGEVARLKSLDVLPSAVQFSTPGEQRELEVIATWSDGSREIVTPLCRFQSNDPQIAAVNADGQITSGRPGDTHIIVYYDNGVKPVPVWRPYADATEEGPIGESHLLPESPVTVAAVSELPIDRLVRLKLEQLNLNRSELAGDEMFLRRVTLDVTGTLPTPEQIQNFVQDTRPDKRRLYVDELLTTPAYAAWWTTFLCDITGNNSQELRDVTVGADSAAQWWYDWIYQRVAANAPYDQIIKGIVVSQSRLNGESYYDYCRRLTESRRSAEQLAMAELDSLPLYWMRRERQTREERAIGFAQNFLGIQIQCAQCHKHPFDQWTQADFEEFSRFFTAVEVQLPRAGESPDQRDFLAIMRELELDPKMRGGQLQRAWQTAAAEGKVIPYPQLLVTRPKIPSAERRAMAAQDPAAARRLPRFYTTAKILGGNQVDLKSAADPREPLMAWTQQRNNPYFAKALVNRVWAKYFGTGLVNPTDDLNLANPPSNPQLLDYLATEFVAQGYDLKWLHREITNSRTYQTSWVPRGNNREDERNFSRAVPRRLPAEVVLDVVYQASGNSTVHAGFLSEIDERAIAVPGTIARGNRNRGLGFGLEAFGRSTRTTECDCDRSNVPSLIQTVYLQNDRDVHLAIARPEGWISEVCGPPVNSRQVSQRAQQLKSARQQLQRWEKALARLGPEASATKRGELEEKRERTTIQIAELQQDVEAENRQIASAERPVWIEAAYLRTLSRWPTAEEIQQCETFWAQSSDDRAALSGILWSLVNTKEFVVNH